MAATREELLERRMPFMEHLTELRVRLRNSVLGILIGTGVSYLFRAQLFREFVKPLIAAWDNAKVPTAQRHMIFTSPIEGFMVMFKLSLLVGLFVSTPILFHQIWRFVAPGLYPRERRYAMPIIFGAVLLFFAGGFFAFQFVLPKSYTYLIQYGTNGNQVISDVLAKDVNMGFNIDPMMTMDEYWGLTSKLLLIFGAVFELPLILGVLSIFGIVSPGMLWRFNRYAILVAFVAGAVLTPGDLVVGQVAMGLSLTVLYNISIIVSFMVHRGRRKAAEEAASDDELAA